MRRLRVSLSGVSVNRAGRWERSAENDAAKQGVRLGSFPIVVRIGIGPIETEALDQTDVSLTDSRRLGDARVKNRDDSERREADRAGRGVGNYHSVVLCIKWPFDPLSPPFFRTRRAPMFKFLHAADIHLDSPLRGLDRYEGAPVERVPRRRPAGRSRTSSSWRSTRRSAFVLIVGDLYDGDWPDYNTGLFFSKQMARLRDAGIPVVLIRGNHDAENRMTQDLRLPDNVRFLSTDEARDGRPRRIRRGDPRPELRHPRGAGQPGAGRIPTRVPRPVQHRAAPHLRRRPRGARARTPRARSTTCGSGSTATGPWATSTSARSCTRTTRVIVFPGNIQGRHVRESGPKGCLLVTVDDAQSVTVEDRVARRGPLGDLPGRRHRRRRRRRPARPLPRPPRRG